MNQPSALAGLSATLHSQFADWLDRRKPQENKMLRMYQDMMRIWRDDDTTEIGTSKAQKSKIFIGSTRSKIRSARAKIKDSLFGSGKLPFDTEPTNEDLKQFADTMEAILEYQLTEADFKKALSTGVDALCTYGTGFIFGPFVKNKTHTSVQQDTSQGYPQLREDKYEYPCPYYEHARTMDVYPDPEAEDVHQGRGLFWASRRQPEFIKALRGKPGYSTTAIDRALVETVTAYTDQGSDRTDLTRQNMYRYTKEGRIWFTRYFGLVKLRELQEWQKANDYSPYQGADQSLAESAETSPQVTEGEGQVRSFDYSETVEAIVIMAGGQVIKADVNPYREQKRPVRRCVYEDVEHEMWGVGVAENNETDQRIVNAAFRLYMEGKAFALLKMFSVDRGKFSTTEDFKLFPGKRFDMRPGLTAEERKEAIIWHDMVDVTDGWEKVIALAEQFSDDDTGITKYTQGTDSSHLNDTATGISMIMNASSLPIKEVLSNIDEMWIEDMIEDLIQWNLDNLDSQTVDKLIGQKHAQVWEAIKTYGKTNFMDWYATGSATFMAKEVLMHKLQGFAQMTGNPEDEKYIDRRELLDQVWNAGQIGKESPVYDEETMKQNQSQGPQAMQQHIQEIEQKAGDLIKEAQAQTAEAKRQEQFKMAELASKEKAAERQHELDRLDRLLKLQSQSVQAHLTEAQTDLAQADTVLSLAQAGATASKSLMTEAEEPENEDSNGETGGDNQSSTGSGGDGMGSAE